MFLGQYAHAIDSKGRLTVPVRYRTALEQGAYLVQGFERNLLVYTTESYERLSQRAAALTTTEPEARAVRRLIFGRATEAALDAVGRILIPDWMREYAALGSEAVIVGAGGYFEIWSTEEWDKELVGVTDPESNARRFAEYDLSAG